MFAGSCVNVRCRVPPRFPMAEIQSNLRTLAEKWAGAAPGERANLQLYVMELCRALLVPEPGFRGSGYEFELAIAAISVDGTESNNFIDCWKAGHFALEGKDDDPSRKGKAGNETLLRKAYGQVRNYVHHVPGETPPPYLMVLDVAKTLVVWDRWAGTYGGFQAGHRIDLATLHERPRDIELLRDIWLNPTARDRRGRAQAVTVDIARKLAQLAAALEDRGHDAELVARFLMRVVFSCFAEDIGLLPAESFRQTITEAGLNGSPTEFQEAVEGMWRMMDVGGRVGPFKFLKFNGHFFKEASALPLTRPELALLEEAARADWSEVEPAIFGTLLTRALDPEERHRLGAEYTPRAFIERLVRPTLEEPVLERWTAVQAEVLTLMESEKSKDRAVAEQRLRDFHAWMRGLSILDPACGSGNFLYVAMHMLKRIELEVIRAIESVTGHHDLRLAEIGPWQFKGIELKPWAREIAELTLWIGFHQFWREHHDVQPPEPILQDTGTLECRDAVIGWREVRRDPSRERPDPTPRIEHPVTGELVPDPAATIPYWEHVAPHVASWPQADFIIGNPPYLGQFRQRAVLGDGYVDALRASYPDVPDAADYVMYWWFRAAQEVAAGRTLRAGLITTSSIVQTQNRTVIADAAAAGAGVMWAIADHVWFDGADGAEVRVAMTVLAKHPPAARLVQVEKVERVRGEVPVVATIRAPRLNADLTVHADVATASTQRLRANERLCSRGFMISGSGFLLERSEAEVLWQIDARYRAIVKPFRNGKDLTARPRDVFVIDFADREESEARQYSHLYDIVRDRVKPERDANNEPSRRLYWWRFGRTNEMLRAALDGLSRYIATPETSKHRIFCFLSGDVAPDNAIVAIGSDDAFVLGVLSSRLHRLWALAAGGRMGVRDTPRYNKGPCFESFPFPDASLAVRQRIGALAEAIEAHRMHALAVGEHITVMKMYDAIEAVRKGAPLSPALRIVHRDAACGTLADLHESLDVAVAEAYGWAWPDDPAVLLERLVDLQRLRIDEESQGIVRWMRPAFQEPVSASTSRAASFVLPLSDSLSESSPLRSQAWPKDLFEQIRAVRAVVNEGPASVDEVASRFIGARTDLVQRHLDTLALMGELSRRDSGHYAQVVLT